MKVICRAFFWVPLLLASLFTRPVLAQPDVSLTRLDCGTPSASVAVNPRFSDTYAYKDLKLDFVYSCYLIKHDDEYLLWDAGHALTAGDRAPKASLVDLLAQLSIKPEQIKYLAVSHYHRDHVGQANLFPRSTLLIGKGDWDALTSAKPSAIIDPKLVSHWIEAGGTVEPIDLDKDVFGDGSVVMLYTPGHTPGHHCLLVRLPTTGYVILSGDLAHFRENYENAGVPIFNIDRAQTIASIERVKKLATNLAARIIVQHDPRDISNLPAFPASAK